MKTYIFHADPSHGWLAVKRAELERLGILNKISSCSYQRGATVYLEEDCDAGILIDAKKEAGEEIVSKESYQERTSIRSYEHFSC